MIICDLARCQVYLRFVANKKLFYYNPKLGAFENAYEAFTFVIKSIKSHVATALNEYLMKQHRDLWASWVPSETEARLFKTVEQNDF